MILIEHLKITGISFRQKSSDTEKVFKGWLELIGQLNGFTITLQ
jgi:hypothetical protein